MTLLSLRCAAALLPVLWLSSLARADVISDFDVDADGWILGSDVVTQPALGNPGGYLLFDRSAFSAPGDDEILAPGKFLGDWSAYDRLSFDFTVLSTGIATQPRRIEISGTGGSATWEGPNFNGTQVWTNVEALLVEADWTLTSGTWGSLLADVNELKIILSDHDPSVNIFFEKTGIDNIALISTAIPEPSAALMTLCFAAGLTRRRSRRKS